MPHCSINTRNLRERSNEAQPRTTGFRVLKSAAVRPPGVMRRLCPRVSESLPTGTNALGSLAPRQAIMYWVMALSAYSSSACSRASMMSRFTCIWGEEASKNRSDASVAKHSRWAETVNFLSHNRKYWQKCGRSSCLTWRFSELGTNYTNK